MAGVRVVFAAVMRRQTSFLAIEAGWTVTEVGRQPWIVQGLLKTSEAHSPNVSSTTIGVSLGVGKARATVWGCDLSREYIHINADYTT
mgnify:CR=1 FL=1